MSQLTPPLDAQLAQLLVEEFIAQEKRFIQGDWEPTQLDGGQFCEILSRILYHQDSGNLNAGKKFEDCCAYVENDQVPHAISPRHDAIHLIKVLKIIYKFRSQRGAVHISPNYTPNHMDSKVVVDMVRWAFSESLRIFWNGDREQVSRAIRELLQFEVPAIGRFEDVLMVQRTDLSPSEEILMLLHYAGEAGFSRKELGKYVMHDPPRITEALKALTSPVQRQVILLTSGRFRLTDIGSKYVREKLSDKMLLG
ncbi:MAG TPA: hypothetical protein VGM18_19750 [Candidatus Sulfotelmatobacter sp.]